MKLENEFTVPVAVEDAWRVLLDVERVAPCMPGATLLTHDGDEFTGTVKVKVGPIQVTYKGAAKFVERDEASRRAVIEASGREARGSGTAAATVTTSLHDAGDGTRVLVETDLNVTGRPAQFGRGVMSEVATKLIGQFADCLSHEVRAGGAAPAEAPAPTEAAAPAQPAAAAAEAAAAEPAPPAEAAVPEQAAAPPTPAEEGAPARPPAAPPLAPTPGGVTEPAAAPPSPAPAAQRSAGPTPVAPVERKPHHASEVIDLVEHAGASVAKRAVPAAGVVLVVALVWRRRRHRRRRR